MSTPKMPTFKMPTPKMSTPKISTLHHFSDSLLSFEDTIQLLDVLGEALYYFPSVYCIAACMSHHKFQSGSYEITYIYIHLVKYKFQLTLWELTLWELTFWELTV